MLLLLKFNLVSTWLLEELRLVNLAINGLLIFFLSLIPFNRINKLDTLKKS